jgi:hypothetical protein
VLILEREGEIVPGGSGAKLGGGLESNLDRRFRADGVSGRAVAERPIKASVWEGRRQGAPGRRGDGMEVALLEDFHRRAVRDAPSEWHSYRGVRCRHLAARSTPASCTPPPDRGGRRPMAAPLIDAGVLAPRVRMPSTPPLRTYGPTLQCGSELSPGGREPDAAESGEGLLVSGREVRPASGSGPSLSRSRDEFVVARTSEPRPEAARLHVDVADPAGAVRGAGATRRSPPPDQMAGPDPDQHRPSASARGPR